MASASQPASAAPAPGTGDNQPGTDEVDEIVARWQAERPDMDVSPLQVLSRVSRLARHLDRARRAAFAAHGLETWEFDVLSALRRQGPPYGEGCRWTRAPPSLRYRRRRAPQESAAAFG